ncbi:pyridoxamine 5'-phosphate oxidase family protein [Aquipuribacter nitratireducens]|uniref:Pyridoxamine 5'-phosphate oxidase family protein n=1 Tax=Aquipuribacter nitratireducens TaxID=650104 RepID=A0ABW0GQJ7_9MICO
MTDTQNAMEELPEERCWALLDAAEVGRLAVVVDSAPDIFPVNHVVVGRSVVWRTAAGTKLFAAEGDEVAYEVDGTDDEGRAWSVVAKGVAQEVDDEVVAEAATRALHPWLDSEKQHVLAVVRPSVTGRRFRVAAS